MRYSRLGLLFIGALAASAVTADAQVITGRITDAQSGQAIAAAQVFVSALDLGALSEGNGAYTIQNVPAGTHTVSVQRPREAVPVRGAVRDARSGPNGAAQFSRWSLRLWLWLFDGDRGDGNGGRLAAAAPSGTWSLR